MQLSKSIILLGAMALVFSSCNEAPKTKFKKGENKRELYKQTNTCADQEPLLCVFKSFDEIRDEQVSQADDEALPSEDVGQQPTKTELDAEASSKNNLAYGKGYKAVAFPTVAVKQGNDGKRRLFLKIKTSDEIAALQKEEKMPSDREIARFINKTCLNKIQTGFNNKSGMDLNLVLRIQDLKKSDDGETQRDSLLPVNLGLPRVSRDADESLARIVLEELPFHSDLFPKDSSDNNEEKRQQKSDGFCRTLAKMVGHALGANDPVAVGKKCEVGIKEHPYKNTSVVIGKDPKQTDFWTKPFLTRERDNLEVNRPSCKENERTTSKTKRNDKKKSKGNSNQSNTPAPFASLVPEQAAQAAAPKNSSETQSPFGD